MNYLDKQMWYLIRFIFRYYRKKNKMPVLYARKIHSPNVNFFEFKVHHVNCITDTITLENLKTHKLHAIKLHRIYIWKMENGRPVRVNLI